MISFLKLHLFCTCTLFFNAAAPLLWDTSIQGTQNLAPEKRPHNLCICHLY